MRGHIHKRVRRTAAGKETVRWYVVVDVGVGADGRRKQKWHGGFGTRREAEVERAKIVNDLHAGGYIAPDRLTLSTWISESWLPMTHTRVKPSTYDSYRSNLELHVLPTLGGKALQQLTAPMLNTLYADLLRRGGERVLSPPRPSATSTPSSIRRWRMPSTLGSSAPTSPNAPSRRVPIAVDPERSNAGSPPSWRPSFGPSREIGSGPPGDWRR